MEVKYLYQVLPFMNELERERREQLEVYFSSAPVWLMDSFKILQLEKGVTFVRENAPVDTVYVIGKGAIKATDYRIFGIAYDFMRFDGIYAMGGMEVVMDSDCYRTTLETVTPCTMISIPKKQFEKWLSTDIRALKQEAKAVGGYLLEDGRKGRAFLFLQGLDRLCMSLSELYEKNARDGEYRLKSTRKELAEQSGLCVKTINRAMKKFENNHWVGRKGNQIYISREQYEIMKKSVSDIIDEL